LHFPLFEPKLIQIVVLQNLTKGLANALPNHNTQTRSFIFELGREFTLC